jgi:hypothetical protein
MPMLYRQTFRLGPFRWNTSRSGVSFTFKLGRFSWNSRNQKARVDLPGPFAWTSAGRRRKAPTSRGQ